MGKYFLPEIFQNNEQWSASFNDIVSHAMASSPFYQRWYENPEYAPLLRPFGPSLHEVISILNYCDDITGFLPHPYTCGTTGVIRHFGLEKSQDLAKWLGAVETSNHSFHDTMQLSSSLLDIGKRWFPNTFDRMEATQELHVDFMEDLELDYFAIGSDAHFPEELGYGVAIDAFGPLSCREAAFEALTTNKNHLGETRAKDKGLGSRILHCSKSALISGHEYWQKRRIRASLRKMSGRRATLALSQ